MKVEQRAAESRSKAALSDKETLLKLYREMLLIRRFEEKTAEMYQAAKIGGFCHLNIGEEATVVGGFAALKPNDYIFTTYREHGHAIARGIDPKAVMAELFGKETGTSHGRGGSMHIYDANLRFMGGYGIVGGHLPLAVGGGWAVKYRKQKDVVVCLFGDGATNIGAFHESLNLSKARSSQWSGTASTTATAWAPLSKRRQRSLTFTRRRVPTTWKRFRSTA